MNRLKTAKSLLAGKRLDAFIVTNPFNILYLSGFKGLSPNEREAVLIFTTDKAYLITAKLYQAEAKSLKSKDLVIKIAKERSGLSTFYQKLLSRAKRIGFEEQNLKVAELKEFKKILKDKRLIPQKNLIEDLRLVKDEEEIKNIEKAQKISQSAFKKLLPTLKLGQTEEEIASLLAAIIKALGGQGLAFESIIASGPNSGKPHHFASNRRLTTNDILLLDFGAKYKNYCADLTRTIFFGTTGDKEKNIYYHVASAQKSAIERIKHGIKGSDAYHAANSIFKTQKLDKYFLHGLGHGIGLEVHEKPSLKPQIPSPDGKIIDHDLLENMVFSVEPGLYFPWGGVRIEDLVVIKNGKAQVLGKTAELIEIPA